MNFITLGTRGFSDQKWRMALVPRVELTEISKFFKKYLNMHLSLPVVLISLLFLVQFTMGDILNLFISLQCLSGQISLK